MLVMGVDPGNNGGISIIKNSQEKLPEIIFTLKMPVVNMFGKKIVDKVGAGDSMIPIISICLANKVDEDIALLLGSIFAAESIKYEANNYEFDKKQLIDTIKTMLKIIEPILFTFL